MNMDPRNFHKNSPKETELHREGDLSDVFAVAAESTSGNIEQKSFSGELSESFVRSQNGVQAASSKLPSWKLRREDPNNSDSQRKSSEEMTENVLTTARSDYTEERVKPQETMIPSQATSDLMYNAATERRKRLEAVIGAAKERAAKGFGSFPAPDESSFRQTKAVEGNPRERSERPKLTARAIRERLAASKYASFRTRSTAGSSVSSATSLPFSRYNEERSPVLHHSPVTSRRMPVLDARSATVPEPQSTNLYEPFASSSSVDDKIRSADELLAKLEINTTSSSFNRTLPQRENDNEESRGPYKSPQMSSSRGGMLDSFASTVSKPGYSKLNSETKQEAKPIAVENSMTPYNAEQTSFQLVDSGGMNTSDDLSSIFESKEPLELELSAFNGSAQAEFGLFGNERVDESFFNSHNTIVSPQNAVYTNSDYSTEEQGYSSLPANDWRTNDNFHSHNESPALTSTFSSTMEDLSHIFQDQGHNNFSPLLSNPEEPSNNASNKFSEEFRTVGVDVASGNLGGQVTVDSCAHPSWDNPTETLSFNMHYDPMFVKEEADQVRQIDSNHVQGSVQRNDFEVFPDPHHMSFPTQTNFEATKTTRHYESCLIFPRKHAIASFGSHGYLLTSFPQIIPGFRVWNGREYVEDTSSVVVKPGALNIVPLIDIVEDTEERFFECIRSLHEDVIYNLTTESMKIFCEKIASNCKKSAEKLLWSILKVFSSNFKEGDWQSFCAELRSIKETAQMEEVSSLATRLVKNGHTNDFKLHSLETLFSNSSKLEDVLRTLVRTENWGVALLISRLVGSSPREQITRQFVYSHMREFPLFSLLTLLSNDIVPNYSDLDSVNWIDAMNILVECETSYRVKGLTAFGDYLLRHRADTFASHCCYVLAGIPICAEKIFSSRRWWEDKDLRMILVGANPGSTVHACFSSIPSIIRTIFYVYLKENQLPIVLSPFLLYMAYVLVETGRLVLAKHLCDFLVNKAHTYLKSNDPHLVSEAQKLTAVYYSYLERLDNRLRKILPDDSVEQGDSGVSLTRSLSKVFRSIAKTGSKKSLRPRSSSNSSWESFAAAAVSIIAPAEESDTTSSMKPARNGNIVSSSEATGTESVPSATSSPVPAKNLTAHEEPMFQSHVSSKHGLELTNETSSPAVSPNKDNADAKVATNQLSSKGDHGNSRGRSEDNPKHTWNDNNNGVDLVSHEKKQSSRRSLSSFLMEKLTKIAGPKQANLGKENKFYYDEKLGRWVCEGGEENSEEVPPPPPSKPVDSSNVSQPAYLKEPEDIRDDMHRAMSRRRWSARARYVDTFGQADQVSGTKPPLVVPPSAATRQILNYSDRSDAPQVSYSMFTPTSTPGDFSDRGNIDLDTSMYPESSVYSFSDKAGTNN